MSTLAIKKVKPIVKIAPLFILSMDLLSLLMYSNESWYWSYYLTYIQRPIFGHSFLISFVVLYFAIRLNLCLYTKIALIGLMCTNLFNASLFMFIKVDPITNIAYYPDVVSHYKLILTVIFLCLSLVFFMKKK